MTALHTGLAAPPRPSSLVAVFADGDCLPGVRAWLREHLEPDSDALLDAELVCTELVTNAVEHADGPRGLRVSLADPARLRVEVDDGSPGLDPVVGRSRLGDLRGRGLTIVDAVCRWGVRRHGGRKTVWATLNL